MTKRTDLLYGRRGGYFAPDDYRPTDFASAKPCDVCGELMILNQRDRHFVCDPLTMVGKTCACPPGCTTELVGDGGTCDPDCAPCSLQQNRLHSDVTEWRRFK